MTVALILLAAALLSLSTDEALGEQLRAPAFAAAPIVDVRPALIAPAIVPSAPIVGRTSQRSAAPRPRDVARAPDGETDLPAIVVIDAGHGGVDPGAIGINGLREKTVTLAVAQRLADRLAAWPRLLVLLTRDDDRFVSLEERAATVADVDADLFVSLHADSLVDRPDVRGAAVYTLAAVAPEMRAVRHARRREGNALRLATAEGGDDKLVHTILQGLLRLATAERSQALAAHMLAELAPFTLLLNVPHRGADFVVLRSPATPSVLVELGYLSNIDDEAALRDPAHQDALAAALSRSIATYLAVD